MITMDHHPHHHNNPQSVEILGHDQAASDTHLNSLLCSLSLLKNKVNEVESMATSSSSSSLSLAGLGTLIQEIIVTASSMMFNCQQMALGSPPPPPAAATTTTGNNNPLPVIYGYDDHPQDGSQFHAFNNKANKYDDEYNRGLDNSDSRGGAHQGQASTRFLPSDEPTFYWYNDTYTSNSSNCTNTASNCTPPTITTSANTMAEGATCDIIEIDASELLAKYTHYCQVCSKGFKRDANLRMHMRAHGEEYKSSAALSNPLKNLIKGDGAIDNSNIGSQGTLVGTKKYSCPQEGCRWNKNHAKFQPLKSMICVKNHYKRSHCPKMYGCSRCNRKQFSVLSDLKTHEKHCGDLRWRCSCGTTFSRKDKLMGHVALFVGHSPVGLRDRSDKTTADVVANIVDPST